MCSFDQDDADAIDWLMHDNYGEDDEFYSNEAVPHNTYVYLPMNATAVS